MNRILDLFVARPRALLEQALVLWRQRPTNHAIRRHQMLQAQREARRFIRKSNRRYTYAHKIFWETIAARRAIFAMTTKNHSDIAFAAPATAAVLDAPLGQLDNALADMEVQFGDFVVTGGLAGTSASLVITVPLMRAFVVNAWVNVAQQNLTVPANTDTYVDVDNAGVLHMSSVANGAAAPALFANSMRLFKAISAAGSVTSVVDLRNLGPIFPGNVRRKGPVPEVDLDAFCVGDGLADDYTNIVAAYNQLPTGGGALVGGPGKTYKYTQALTFAKHVRLRGAGRDLDNTSNPPTVFSYQPAGAGTDALTVTAHACVLEGFILVQGNAQANTRGLVLSGVFNVTRRDITVVNFTGVGITLAATAGASCIWNQAYNERSANNTGGGLALTGNPGAAKTVNANGHFGCQYTGNGLANPNVKLTGGASENGFFTCDVTGGNAQTLVQVGDGVNLARGNHFLCTTAEGGAGGGVGFNLQANSSMTWISGEILATTKINAAAGVTYLFWDHVGNVWSTGGQMGVNFDPGGGLGINAATQGPNTLNGPTGWNLMAAGTTVATLQNTLLTSNQSFAAAKDIRRSKQTIAFNATPAAPDPTLGEIYAMAALTGNVTAIPNPVNSAIGQHLRFYWTQDATGGRTVAYSGTNYRTGGATAFLTTLSTATIDDFECIDGTIWRLISRITGQAI